MPGVDPEFIVHKLNMDQLYPSKKQKPRRPAKEHVKTIKEIFFPEWLSNTVVEKKKKKRMANGGFVLTLLT